MRYQPDSDEDEQLKQDTITAVHDAYDQLLETGCGPDDVIGLIEDALAAARKWKDAR